MSQIIIWNFVTREEGEDTYWTDSSNLWASLFLLPWPSSLPWLGGDVVHHYFLNTFLRAVSDLTPFLQLIHSLTPSLSFRSSLSQWCHHYHPKRKDSWCEASGMVMIGRKLRDGVTVMNKIRPEASRIRNSPFTYILVTKKKMLCYNNQSLLYFWN